MRQIQKDEQHPKRGSRDAKKTHAEQFLEGNVILLLKPADRIGESSGEILKRERLVLERNHHLSLRDGGGIRRLLTGCAVSSVVEHFLDTDAKTAGLLGFFNI